MFDSYIEVTVEKMVPRKRARDFLYWLTLASDIDKYVDRCSACNSNESHQQKEPLVLLQITQRPWSFVASDLITWNGSNYLVLVDSYSGWFEVDGLTTTTAQAVTTKLKNYFATFGITDSQFSATEFIF